MKNLLYLLLIVTLAQSYGCTFYHVNAEEIVMANQGERRPIEQIQYLETVTVPYKVLGQVSVWTERRNSKEEVIEKMKRQVAVLGGDAITNIQQKEDARGYTTIRTHYIGTVIAFTDPNQKQLEVPVSKGSSTENFK